jgi:hypothetical protein
MNGGFIAMPSFRIISMNHRDHQLDWCTLWNPTRYPMVSPRDAAELGEFCSDSSSTVGTAGVGEKLKIRNPDATRCYHGYTKCRAGLLHRSSKTLGMKGTKVATIGYIWRPTMQWNVMKCWSDPIWTTHKIIWNRLRLKEWQVTPATSATCCRYLLQRVCYHSWPRHPSPGHPSSQPSEDPADWMDVLVHRRRALSNGQDKSLGQGMSRWWSCYGPLILWHRPLSAAIFCMTLYDSVRLCVILYDRVWLLIIPYDSLWLCDWHTRPPVSIDLWSRKIP